MFLHFFSSHDGGVSASSVLTSPRPKIRKAERTGSADEDAQAHFVTSTRSVATVLHRTFFFKVFFPDGGGVSENRKTASAEIQISLVVSGI